MTINHKEKITEMYAFISIDEGGEGVVGMTMPDDPGVAITRVPALLAAVEALRIR